MRAFLLHLRFPFVFVLAPIFVWGARWGPSGWTADTTLGFLLVHLALYPGANAYNSAFDRDEGPIGGLAAPPPVSEGLGRWSAALQGAGAALSPLVGLDFSALYVALWGIFTAYSHPRTRWKRSAVASTAAIVVGQGVIGTALGWVAAGGVWAPGARALAAGAASTLAVAALWPWTQAYQVEADLARSDRTLAAALGVRGTLGWTAAGLGGTAWILASMGLAVPAAVAGAGAAGALTALAAAPPGWSPDHRTTMLALYALSAAFLAWTIGTWEAAG